MRTTVRTTPGQSYILIAWIRIASETGTGWGGFRAQVLDKNWKGLAASSYLLQAQCGSDWYQVTLSFTATTNQSIVQLGYVGSAKRTMVTYVDDVQVSPNSALSSMSGSLEVDGPVVPAVE